MIGERPAEHAEPAWEGAALPELLERREELLRDIDAIKMQLGRHKHEPHADPGWEPRAKAALRYKETIYREVKQAISRERRAATATRAGLDLKYPFALIRALREAVLESAGDRIFSPYYRDLLSAARDYLRGEDGGAQG